MAKINIQPLFLKFYVRKLRFQVLVNEYRTGLVIGKKDNASRDLSEGLQDNDKKYAKLIKVQENISNDVTSNDLLIEKKLARFEKKQYWKLREYKTLNKDKENLNELLVEFANFQAEEKKDYLKQLKEKYLHLNYPLEVRNIAKERITELEKEKEEKNSQIQKRYSEKQKSILIFEEKTNKYLEKKNAINEKRKSKIDLIYEDLFVGYTDKLVLVNKKLEELSAEHTTLQEKKEKQYQKKLNKLILLKERYEALIEYKDKTEIQLMLRNLKMYFGGVKAIDDLSFEVKQGEIFGLIGPNGAGKTTVFNCITQFYKPTEGDVLFRNKDGHLVELNNYKTHHMIKEGIARSFQNVELIWELTVLDNLLVSAHTLFITNLTDYIFHTVRLKRQETVLKAKAYRLLQTLGIEDFAFRSPFGLPYGILKKIELARTLMTDPTMIILDEPAAGLNDSETLDLANVIKKINKELDVTIFLVEHDMGLVMNICDTICAISFGKLLGIGTAREIQNNENVRKAYLGDDSDE